MDAAVDRSSAFCSVLSHNLTFRNDRIDADCGIDCARLAHVWSLVWAAHPPDVRNEVRLHPVLERVCGHPHKGAQDGASTSRGQVSHRLHGTHLSHLQLNSPLQSPVHLRYSIHDSACQQYLEDRFCRLHANSPAAASLELMVKVRRERGGTECGHL